MVTLNSDSRPIIGRGPPLGARFFLLAIISVAVMVYDHRQTHVDAVREWLSAAVYPVHALVQSPFQLWDWINGSFADRDRLRRENAQLRTQLRIFNLRLLRFESLAEENRRLRDIRESSAGITEKTQIAEIMRVDLDPFRHRVLINKGTEEGVFKGQPVLDAEGVFGQVTRPGRYSSEVILISDSEHAIPVQTNRNGIRTIAVGTGDLNKLTVPFLTGDTDVKVDDLLVTSGLGGIFPAGYPVARISRVERDPAETFAVVEAKPLARLNRDREVLLVWYQEPQIDAPPPPVKAAKISTKGAAKGAAAKPGAKPATDPAANPATGPTVNPETGADAKAATKAEAKAGNAVTPSNSGAPSHSTPSVDARPAAGKIVRPSAAPTTNLEQNSGKQPLTASPVSAPAPGSASAPKSAPAPGPAAASAPVPTPTVAPAKKGAPAQ